MCGIAAVFAYDGRADVVDPAELECVAGRMGCRGPDGAGEWVSDDGRIGMAHRRLAIIDLSCAGAQPMRSGDGRYTIVYNGEIYNYRELRAGLERRGAHFRSHSDTEVLLHLYAEHGASMLPRLRGMFALAIWDSERRGLFLARDPFGVKPLYVSDDGRTLRVASEVKALLASRAIDTAPEPAGHVGFFLWGSVPEPYTLFRGIRSLPAGRWSWLAETGERQTGRYFDLAEVLSTRGEVTTPLSPMDVHDGLRTALLDSTRHHLESDVDVGVFLSAGLDSTTLAALAAELGGPVRSVTLGFEEYRDTRQDEVPLAEMVARANGLDHQTIWVTRHDFEMERERLLDRMDQPSIDGVNTYFVSRAAAQAGLKVALSGVGGDELFGGYPSFRQMPRLVAMAGAIPASRTIGRGMRWMLAPALGAFTSRKFAGLLEYGGDYGGAYLLRRGLFLPWELDGLLDTDLVGEGLAELAPRASLEALSGRLSNGRLKVSALEAAMYMRNQLLRDTDWASMSWSLEVRTPLVDATLWRAVSALTHGMTGIDKRLMATTPAVAPPRVILDRAKSGFAIPTNEWVSANGARRRESRGLRGWALRVYEASTGGGELLKAVS